MDSKKQLTGKQLDLIRNYLLLKAVPSDLRARILEYYQYIFTSSQSMEDLRLLQHMPLNLATQLALSVNAKIITKCVFFQGVSDASLAALVSTLSPLVFVPGQLMCSEGQLLRTIYFINRGKVQLVKGAGGEAEMVVRMLGENDNLGLEDFASSADRLVQLTARSLSYCDVMSLSTEELAAALEHDAAERLKAEAARLRIAAERAASGGTAPSDAKKHLTTCFRKAGHIAKISSAFRGKTELPSAVVANDKAAPPAAVVKRSPDAVALPSSPAGPPPSSTPMSESVERAVVETAVVQQIADGPS